MIARSPSPYSYKDKLLKGIMTLRMLPSRMKNFFPTALMVLHWPMTLKHESMWDDDTLVS